ncbi:hypothetical protein CK203_032037 [Vitis vinifera]|uniref:Basic secretory protease n=1 Tax=Vitis vinifera TaxID=29760 RepID=A0A438FNF3_VITVI|nr:hypothetical protein CK203_032037 [Vitis vinifera]
MAPKHMFLLSCLVILAALQGIHAVEFEVINNAESSAGGIPSQMKLNTEQDRKDVQKVTLIIDNMDGVAYATNDEIHFNANYIGNYSGDLRMEFTGIIFHEMTHIWQWNGDGQAPRGLTEGIADFVRLSADFSPSHWVQPGEELNKKMGSDYSED